MSLLLQPQDTDSIYHSAHLYVFLCLKHELGKSKKYFSSWFKHEISLNPFIKV